MKISVTDQVAINIIEQVSCKFVKFVGKKKRGQNSLVNSFHLYRLQEADEGFAVGRGQCPELLRRLVGVALGTVAVPHDGLFVRRGSEVVHLIVAAGADGLQALAPKRGGAAGIGTHSAAKQVEVVLQEVRVGPDGLIGKLDRKSVV